MSSGGWYEMERKLFADLVTSLKEAAALSNNKARPARQAKIDVPDIKYVCKRRRRQDL